MEEKDEKKCEARCHYCSERPAGDVYGRLCEKEGSQGILTERKEWKKVSFQHAVLFCETQ